MSTRRHSPNIPRRATLGMLDHQLLLEVFELTGRHRYGGVEEGLCCMPGCVKNTGLFACGRFQMAKYCCAERQRFHYKMHKNDRRKMTASP
jgi:hypothetical protein